MDAWSEAARQRVQIIPTVVPATLEDVAEAADRSAGFASTLHIDVADGVFAPNTTWMPSAGEVLPQRDGFVYEAHLMVAQPREIGIAFIRAGAGRLIGHVEAMETNVEETFDAWKKAGASECALGTLFNTPVERLAPFISHCDAVMFMAITAIGVQGLPADPDASAHAAALRALNPNLLIEVDGAVSEKNIAGLARAGVRRFCVGSALSKSPDPASTYHSLITLAKSGLE